MVAILHKTFSRTSSNIKWNYVAAGSVFLLAAVLAFHNLEYGPRPRHDAGAVMTLARTLAEDGVYAGRNSDGYQTFGAVQSVGPTVVIPMALSFKLFGVGLVQARLVMAVYLLLTLAVFFQVGREMFETGVALLAVALLLGSQSAQYLFYGRQVLGEVPALGFLLGGWLAWSRGMRTGQHWLYPIAGLLIGAAIVTKSQYLIIGFGTLTVLSVLELLYFRQGHFKTLVVVALVTLACVGAWSVCQMLYFGVDTFLENAAKMRQLAASTAGFDRHTTLEALKFILGPGSGYFYYFWGFTALIYIGVLSIRRTRDGLVLAFLLIASVLGLSYFLFWAIPWTGYVVLPAALAALFVSRLWHDIFSYFTISWHGLWTELRQSRLAGNSLALVALITLAMLICVPLLNQVRLHVLSHDIGPYQVATFLQERVEKDLVIETWERELGVFTDHRYHFPDQSLYGPALRALWRGGPRDYALGEDYFLENWPSYVVIGGHAKWTGVYDTEFIAENGYLVATFGEGLWEYDIYRLRPPLSSTPEEILNTNTGVYAPRPNLICSEE
jgi:4-amino-4-deoxy-L-arabinose transferase-like glycosyltransferase